jgi:hypothetical protein
MLNTRSPLGRRRLTVIAHLGQMRTHGIACFVRVMVLHCIENPLVMNLAAFGATRNSEDS